MILFRTVLFLIGAGLMILGIYTFVRGKAHPLDEWATALFIILFGVFSTGSALFTKTDNLKKLFGKNLRRVSIVGALAIPSALLLIGDKIFDWSLPGAVFWSACGLTAILFVILFRDL